MERLDCPANDVEPHYIVMNQVDDQRKPLLLVQVERDDQNQPEKRRHRHHRDFEPTLHHIRSEHDQLGAEVANLNCSQDHCLGEEVVDEEGVDGSEEEGEYRLLQGFKENSQQRDLFAVLHEVLDELSVMDQEESQPADREEDEEEEEYQHEALPYFVVHICGVEEAALREEVEGELLNISLEDYQKENSVEGILSY